MTLRARLWLPIATGLLAVALAHAQPVATTPAPGASPGQAPVAITPSAPVAPVPPAGTTVTQPPRPSVSSRAPMRTPTVRQAPAPRPEASPTWAELTPLQQQSLGPLAGTWRVLGEAHKRKWLALSENYPTMQPAEQALLHSRMTEWAALSPQQRTLARLNFAEAQTVSPRDKRAKWEAYQALPPEEKRKLAAGAAATAKPPPSTAIAVHPVPQQKLAHIPKSRRPGNAARIAVLPGQVDNNTLLPQPLAPVQP